MQEHDLLIIGGGINGCGIARDASGRGLDVILCEMNDIASATSSWSTKLIHGGLRYLENYEFKLVKEALKEREVLMHSAPFIIHPLRFILPYEEHLRSPLLIRMGLLLYDHLYRRKLIPKSSKIKFDIHDPGNALKNNFRFGFDYYDCQTDDSRLTLLNALAAAELGADIRTYTKCTKLINHSNYWEAHLEDQLGHQTDIIKAKAVVNASGPWVSITNDLVTNIKTNSRVQLVKGSHIIVPKLYEGFHAYILQNEDNRIVFAIPYKENFTLIGTTDVEYKGDPSQVKISQNEIDYLCSIINHYFKTSIHSSDIISAYSGVRPLYNNDSDNPSKTTREYHLEIFNQKNYPPYLSVFGGKITTFRVLAEDCMSLLAPYFPNLKPNWTAHSYLPGGQLESDWNTFLTNVQARYSWLPASQVKRYAVAYGTNIHNLIGDATSIDMLGAHFGSDLYEQEILYWIQNEWAQSCEDMIWRRSKLGLFLNQQQQTNLKNYIDNIKEETE